MLPPNPYAFPLPGETNEGSTCSAAEPGMTLRDYFAGQALIGVINQSIIAEVAKTIMAVAAANGVTEHDVMVRSAYRFADAMLAEREKVGA